MCYSSSTKIFCIKLAVSETFVFGLGVFPIKKMQVSTHNQDTPAANKQHKIEDQLPEYFNHGRILAPLAGIIPDLSFNLVGHHGLQS